MVEAWDGWCNYGIAEDDRIKFVVPEEGSDLWVDTMTVVESSKNKEAAMTFVNFILSEEIGTWVAENILYAVPNKTAMEGLSEETLAAYPTLAIPLEDRMSQEAIYDVGEFSTAYTDLNTKVLSSN